MFLKGMSLAVLGTLLAAAGTLAAGYRPDDFLTLDLSKAVLSPTPLGPRNQFVPMPVQAKVDFRSDSRSNGKPEPSYVSRARVTPLRTARSHQNPLHTFAPLHAFAEKRRGAARARLAHRHGNPLDAHAQAVDHRIRTWPCRSGGICNWKWVPMAEE
ncbi:hypothetical protein [Bradyrhizobium sp.]|uniref:hypothetical protein n=1 Tax=Bradyrhizobium sp. TaxID=376 RepID=UPI001DAE0F16|nr:hypothetical protein [Bradyrhizobium sp.]MBV8696272.1 hypothetical protein [Bradyrhizobium sp.]MBV8921537.1 hypothetical protein [Bradyrhizobium sp.]MBV9983072.1 hypothetical protein [Bradyrhizobium sp.]